MLCSKAYIHCISSVKYAGLRLQEWQHRIELSGIRSILDLNQYVARDQQRYADP